MDKGETGCLRCRQTSVIERWVQCLSGTVQYKTQCQLHSHLLSFEVPGWLSVFTWETSHGGNITIQQLLAIFAISEFKITATLKTSRLILYCALIAAYTEA